MIDCLIASPGVFNFLIFVTIHTFVTYHHHHSSHHYTVIEYLITERDRSLVKGEKKGKKINSVFFFLAFFLTHGFCLPLFPQKTNFEMFQPQATPLNHRSSYGQENNNIGTFAFQDSGYPVSAGGPILFETPAFSSQGIGGFTPINNTTNPPTFFAKMSESNNYHGDSDKAFQDELSRAEHESMKYEPEITVSRVNGRRGGRLLIRA